jgi:hypothetical protein
MKNPLDALYAHHEEAEQLFAQSEDIHARNELAQSLTCTRDLIYRLESGEVVMIQEIEEIIALARSKLDTAYKMIDGVADTLRSGELNPNQDEND